MNYNVQHKHEKATFLADISFSTREELYILNEKKIDIFPTVEFPQ